MRRWTQFTLGLLWTGTVWAQPQDPIKVFMESDPPGAAIYTLVPSDQSHQKPYLREADGSILLDLKPYSATKAPVRFKMGGSSELERAAEVPSFHGYQASDEIVVAFEAFPMAPGQGARRNDYHHPSLITLKPAPGLAAMLQRTAFWFQFHYLISLTMVLATVGGGFAFIVVGLPTLRENARRNRFLARLKNLDVENDLFLAREFGEWVTVQRLGAGGMAVVYKGVSTQKMDMDDAGAVAIKVMNPDLAEDIDYRRRFQREIQISRTLDHPNVVRTIDFGEQQKSLYLVMEFMEGEDLRKRLPEKGFPLIEAIPLAMGICQGLIHAHDKGVVHRDLKPDNVMLTKNGLIKVMDLGLAKRNENPDNVTRTGDTFGTPAYMAPEQITGATLLPATDQYALGVMLFEMVTGRRPFEVADSLTLVMKHLQEPPPRVRDYKSQLPEELDLLIDRMLLKDPNKRYPSLKDVLAELQKIQRKYCPQ